MRLLLMMTEYYHKEDKNGCIRSITKIQELKEIYGDIEVMVKSNSEGNEFLRK